MSYSVAVTLLKLTLLAVSVSVLTAQTCRMTPLLPVALPPNVDVEPLSASRTLSLRFPIPVPNGVLYFSDTYARRSRELIPFTASGSGSGPAAALNRDNTPIPTSPGP